MRPNKYNLDGVGLFYRDTLYPINFVNLGVVVSSSPHRLLVNFAAPSQQVWYLPAV